MGLKLFLTGASGYLGSVLGANLAGMPEVERITGTVNTNWPSVVMPENVKLIKMDIRSPELVDHMAGHDVVLHTAFVVLWPKKMPQSVRDDINFNGTRNVAQAAAKCGVTKFIHASSLAAYDPEFVRGKQDLSEDIPIGNGTSPMYYWNSKALTEKQLRDVFEPTDIILTLFRIPNIIGPHNRTTVPEFRANAANFPGHDPIINFVHENDICSAYELALRIDMPGGYNVVPDDSVKASELFKLLDVKPMTIPIWLAQFVTYIRWIFLGSNVHPSWIPSQLVDFSVSNAKLKAAGWMPQFSCADAIRTAI